MDAEARLRRQQLVLQRGPRRRQQTTMLAQPQAPSHRQMARLVEINARRHFTCSNTPLP